MINNEEKIKKFATLLRKAKGDETFNAFIGKCDINSLRVIYFLQGKSQQYPSSKDLKAISDNSEGRITYEELLDLFEYKRNDTNAVNNTKNKTQILRGDIYNVDLGVGIGSEQSGVRPVLVIQNNVGNLYSPTVIVAAITSQMTKAKLPTHVEMGEECGLLKDSICMLEQIRTIDKSRLGQYIGKCTPEIMIKLNKAYRISGGVYNEIDEAIDEMNSIEQSSKNGFIASKILSFKKALINKVKTYNYDIVKQLDGDFLTECAR